MFLPRNLPHVFRSMGGPATALLIVTPGGLDEYFAELSAALAANADSGQVKMIQQAPADGQTLKPPVKITRIARAAKQ